MSPSNVRRGRDVKGKVRGSKTPVAGTPPRGVERQRVLSVSSRFGQPRRMLRDPVGRRRPRSTGGTVLLGAETEGPSRRHRDSGKSYGRTTIRTKGQSTHRRFLRSRLSGTKRRKEGQKFRKEFMVEKLYGRNW